MTDIRKELAPYLESDYLAVVGRVLTYLKEPEMATLPVSCTTFVPTFSAGGVTELIEYISTALCTGAGVNVHLDNFRPWPALVCHDSSPECRFEIDPSHPDYHYFDPFQRLRPEAGSDAVIVSDSLSEDNQSWIAPQGHDIHLVSIKGSVYLAYIYGCMKAPCSFDVSHLRPNGLANSLGMVSSGPHSFANLLTSAYNLGYHGDMVCLLGFISSFNEELRRGGKYRNGAITTSLSIFHPQAEDYLKAPKQSHPWLKKGLVLPSDYRESPLVGLMLTCVNDGSLFTEKAVIQSPEGHQWLPSTDARMSTRLLSNVCREVLLPNKGTCNLSHVNLGQIKQPEELSAAFELVMEFLCKLHASNPQAGGGIYLDASEDKQVGMGLLGLANMLARFNIAYRDFVVSLDRMITVITPELINKLSTTPDVDAYAAWQTIRDLESMDNLARSYDEYVATEFIKAYIKAAQVACGYGMERAFVIAPTANSSFKYKDTEGWSTCPEISPPVAGSTERLSEVAEESQIYYYPDNVELASEVGFMWYRILVETMQRLMNATGLAHSISFNIWEDVDERFLDWFDQSPTLTTYYRLAISQDYLNKSTQFAQPNPGIQCDCAG